MRNGVVASVVGVWIVGSLGCGGGGGGGKADGGTPDGGSRPPPATASEFCQEVEALNLAALMKCYGGKAADWPIFFGESTCASLDAAVANHKVTYDATKAAACLEKLAKPTACSEDSPPGPWCGASVLVGAVADGEPCENSYSCHPGTNCEVSWEISDSCGVKVCHHLPAAGEKCLAGYLCDYAFSCVGETCVPNLKLGEACDPAGAPYCGQNLYCAAKDPRPTCKRAVENGPCADGLGCFDYQYCDATGHCHARLDLGGDCTGDPSACGSFTACDPATHRCVEASRVGQLCGNLIGLPFMCQGGACIPDADQVNHCVVLQADGEACAHDYECSGVCTSGKCATPPPNDGAVCTDDTLCAAGKCGTDGTCGDGSFCLNANLCTSSICEDGTCKTPSPDGANCLQGYECVSSRCTNGKCAPLGPIGEPCADGATCASGHCVVGKCAACM